ncbi:MAG TPA: immunoglobulin domain-containing protein, partial [Pyrinomonadaceae bacterium]|nr:immunoglobulin domain-containing protein [Pyrinomonadaceae bacterium]
MAIFSLLAASVLAFAIAPGTVSAAGRAERSNHRVRVPSAAAAKSAATANFPLPFAAIDVDRTDDAAAASACTAAPNDCSLRGAVAFANLNPGTTINVPAGTYQLNIPGAGEGFTGNNAIGDLDIRGNNTIVAGAGAATTIIQQTTANDRVIEVNPDLLSGFDFAISGVTITGGKETTGVGGGGIISGSIDNTMSVTNCVISANSASGNGTPGGGGILHTGGSLTITGTTFSGNSTSASGGGLGYSAGDPLIRTPSIGTLSVSGSTFSGNSAGSIAAGGGAADLFNFNSGSGTYNINSSTFSGNTAPNGNGGAIVVESGPLTLTTSSLSGNSAGVTGGAISSSGSASVTFSRLVGNTVPNPLNGLTLFAGSASFTANDNWWGINTGPSANDFRNAVGSLFPMTFLQLRASASPDQICSGALSTLTADIKQRNSGAPLTTELNGLPEFPAVFSNVIGGTVSGATNFVNGVATATFTAGATPGPASVDVTGDNQTVTANMTIDTNQTTDPADQVVCEGATATFTTTASGPGTATFVWKKGATVLNNGDLGGRVTITSGSNTSTLTITGTVVSDADTYTV